MNENLSIKPGVIGAIAKEFTGIGGSGQGAIQKHGEWSINPGHEIW